MKKALALLLSLAMILSLAACGGNNAKNNGGGSGAGGSQPSGSSNGSGGDEGGGSGKSLTFGWSVYDLANPFFIPMDEGVQAKCKELGITLLPTHDEKGDATEMITGVTALIEQGIDALVISPYSPESLSTVTALAEEAGIPVIVVDIGTGGASIDAFIRSDMYGGGCLAGQYFMDVMADGSYPDITSKNVAIIKCETSATYAITRGEGFKDTVTPGGYTVVDEQHGNSNKDEAYSIMLDYIAKYGDDLAAVFCENDQMALGAAAAIDENGLTGKILVYGFDGNDDALAAISEGKMGGTVAQDPFGMGGLGVELAYQLCSGEALSEDEVDGDGNKVFLAPVKMIDKEGNTIG